MINGGELCILNEIVRRSEYSKYKFNEKLRKFRHLVSKTDWESDIKLPEEFRKFRTPPILLYEFNEKDEVQVYLNPYYEESKVKSVLEAEYTQDTNASLKDEAEKLTKELSSLTEEDRKLIAWLEKVNPEDSFELSISNDLVTFHGQSSNELDWVPTEYSTYWDELELDIKKKFSRNLVGKMKLFFYRQFEKVGQRLKSGDKMDILEFFDHVKDALELLDAPQVSLDRLQGYVETLARLKKSRSEMNRAVEKAMLILSESKLSNKGYKYLSEAQVVEFIRKSKRGLAFTYLKDYKKIIPESVIKEFEKAESTNSFDDYIILHYAKSKKQKKEIKENADKEAARRRDPILFGLIKGSRKLYYIADWITEDDDLTLEKLLSTISSEANLV